MAKSESTAVNELISLVQGGSPSRDDVSDDLFGPPKSKLAPPRMTSTIPPMRGAGEVAPLPPQRAPTGTSQLGVNKPVRMVTAPPARAASIPPLPQRASAAPPPRPSAQRASSPAPQQLVTPPPRPSPAAKLPPPRPSAQIPAQAPTQARGSVAPIQPTKARGTGPQRTTPPTTTPIAAPFEQPNAVERPAIDRTGDAISADHWFEASRMVEKVDETWVGTSPAPKRDNVADTIKKIMLPLVIMMIVSGGVAYVVFSHHVKKTAPVTHVTAPVKPSPAVAQTPAAPSTESANAATATAGGTQPEPPLPSAAPAATPGADDQVAAHPNANEQKIAAHPNANDAKIAASAAPVAAAPVAAAPVAAAPVAAAPVPAAAVQQVAEAAPVVHEVPTNHGVIKLVDVRIDSKPAGATVMLVDNGKTSFLGTTPVAASVDPSRSYDVVLTLDGRPTQVAHLDPNKAQKLQVTLGKAGAKAETPKAASAAPKATSSAPKAAPARKHVAASAPAGGIVDPGFDAPKAEAPAADSPKADAPKADAGGEGTLMVSSKPPCEIWIDGKDTGLMTPQKAMSLPAGAHKVTFSNPGENITKTVTVKITADQSTKLIQNLMQ